MDMQFLQNMLNSMKNENSDSEAKKEERQRALRAYRTRIERNPNSMREMSSKGCKKSRRRLK